MEFQEIAIEIAILFVIMLIGAYGGRAGYLSEAASESINKVVVNITNPCLVIYGLQREFSRSLLHNGLMLAVSGLVVTLILIGISELWARRSEGRERGRVGTEQFLITFGNLAFLGIPILQVIYGNLGIFYVCMFGMAQNLLMFSYGYRVFGEAKGPAEVAKQLLNNSMIALIVAMVLFVAGLKLPYLIYQPVSLVGNLTVPLILLSVGSSISRIPLKELFCSKAAWIVSAFKLAVCPLVLVGVFLLLPVPGDVAAVTVIMMAMPAALLTSPMSETNGGDVMLANKSVILSNLLVMFTMPCVIWLLGAAGLS